MMPKKVFKILFIICLLAVGYVAHAEGRQYIFEVGIPWFNTQNVNGLGDLVNRIIVASYRVAMLFALYKIIEIGFKYMTGTGKADVMVNVSKGMKNVLIGILILFGSYIILYTINPDLTKMPRNINCPAESEFCDEKTTSRITEKTVLCSTKPVIYADELNEGVSGAGHTTEDDNITASSIQEWVNRYSASIYKSPDWEVALKDLKTGNVSSNIWAAIKKAIEDKSQWLDETSCSGTIEPGPIFTAHEKAGDYVSCHDTYEAVDFVVRDKNQDYVSDDAIRCMKALMRYLQSTMSDKLIVCDETMFKPPHIHVQDISCKVPCRTK